MHGDAWDALGAAVNRDLQRIGMVIGGAVVVVGGVILVAVDTLLRRHKAR